jgi:hypothetical protein
MTLIHVLWDVNSNRNLEWSCKVGVLHGFHHYRAKQKSTKAYSVSSLFVLESRTLSATAYA